ncbi:MAG: glycoside hydrolase family 95 protein, partial [Ruthenibacterium sp.]
MWYDTPASEWLAALPVGNGALGAMVPGNVCEETLFLNDDTLWAGYPREESNSSSLPALPKIRELIFSGQYGKAQKLVNKALLGSHSYTEPYEPMGELTLSFPTGSAVQNYRRILDMEQGIVTVEWEQNGICYTREVFSSAVDGVLVVHLTASQPGGLCCAVGAHSPLRHHVQTVGQQRLFVHGKAPSHIHVGNLSTFDKDITVEYSEDEAKGMPFVFGVEVLTQGGCCTAQANGLCVERADTVTFLVASATRYREKEPLAAVEAHLKHAAALAYPVLVSRHVQDFSALFNRTRLTFALQEFQLAVPTDRLLKGVQDGDFSALLVAQMFTYGRYLLLSSSRPGTQAANLQGIWNKDVTPPWWANYTNNINLEMNYWPAKVCGLAECEEPLFDFIKRLQQNGRQTAQKSYGCRGWTAHHQTDLWAFTHPVGEVSDTYPCCARWAMWPMAPAWLCRHLWEHYEFTLDVDFLRQRAWPAMREAARFVLDWLVEGPDGTLVTCPSTSPENTFFLPDGTEMDVSYGSTMDLSLARDLFQNCLSAGAALGLDDPLLQEIEAA